MSAAAATAGAAAPASGLAGLKHWRHDAVAGLQVALLWTPFSLGVAIASGAPAFAGLVSAIVAGLLYPWLGGSHVTVSGPAAALAPVLLWGMLLLGEGDLVAGYPLVLVAIVATGALQLLASALRAGQYASMLPATVVEAMLAAIGILIIVRQVPTLAGVAVAPSPSVLHSVMQWPALLAKVQTAVLAVGLASLALMYAARRFAHRGPLRWLPPAIVVAALGIVAGQALGFGPELLIRMPSDPRSSVHLPAFAEAAARPELWLPLALVVFTFTMIDGVESVASVKAVDKIDPWRRKSDANKTLRAMGTCNLVSGMLGGLTVIPNAVPSRANIDAGARTLWSNLYSGLFLLLFVLVLPGLLARIPLAAIAAILIYIGWRLCEPALFKRMLTIGRDRFIVFVATVAAILLTDLLIGMLIGIAIELALLLYLLMPSVRLVLVGRLDTAAALKLLATNFASMFRSPVLRHRTETRDGRTVQVLTLGSLVGFNLLQLERAISRLPAADGLILRFTESAHIIDHTAAELLHELREDAARAGRTFAIEGLDNFHRFSRHPHAALLQEPQIRQQQALRDERAQRMQALASELGLTFRADTQATINAHDFVYLQRGDQREECNVMEGPWLGARLRVFDYSHTSAPEYHLAHRHTLVVYVPAAGVVLPPFVLTPGHYLERYLVRLREVEGGVPHGHRLYAPEGAGAPPLTAAVLAAVHECGPLYIESRGDALLLFAPQRALEEVPQIRCLLHTVAVLVGAEAATPQAALGHGRPDTAPAT